MTSETLRMRSGVGSILPSEKMMGSSIPRASAARLSSGPRSASEQVRLRAPTLCPTSAWRARVPPHPNVSSSGWAKIARIPPDISVNDIRVCLGLKGVSEEIVCGYSMKVATSCGFLLGGTRLKVPL